MLKKPGYIDSKIIYCSSTKDDRVLNVNLEKEHYGYLSLSSSVNSVKIFVDGKFKMTYMKGKSSRLKLKEGNYTVSAKKEGYRDFRTNVFIENKGRTSVRMNLDKIEYGFLKLTSSGSAKIFVDNVFKFEMNGAKAKYIKLAEGSHTVKAIVNGRVEERRVKIGADGNESISF
jgi:hypothetical protein